MSQQKYLKIKYLHCTSLLYRTGIYKQDSLKINNCDSFLGGENSKALLSLKKYTIG